MGQCSKFYSSVFRAPSKKDTALPPEVDCDLRCLQSDNSQKHGIKCIARSLYFSRS